MQLQRFIFQIEILKISRRRPPSIHDAELGDSRCCFAEDGKEMYKASQSTCTAIVFLIKDFVWQGDHSRPKKPRSFWSAPRIATSDQVQRQSGFEWLCKHNRLRPGHQNQICHTSL